MSPWVFNVYMDGVIKEVKMGMGRRGVRFLEDGREWRLPDLLYADNLVLCGELDEDLRAMVGWFVEVCMRGLEINAGKSKVMVLNGEEVHVDGIHLQHFSELKYLGCVLDESGTDRAECSKVVSGMSVAGAIRPLVNARYLHLECAKILA